MRLAQAQLEAGAAADAAATYDACLNGVFGADLEIRRGAARANLACGRIAEAISHLDYISKSDPSFRAEEIALLRALSLGAGGRKDEARAAFEDALARFGSFTVRAEFAIWAAAVGETQLAAAQRPELERAMQRWTRNTRDLHADLIRRLDAAYAA